MNIFLDESVAKWLAFRLGEHVVESSSTMDWLGIQNGALLRLVSAAGFDVFITADKNLRHQQQLVDMNFATVVLSTNHGKTIKPKVQAIRDALTALEPGTVSYVDCGRFVPRRHIDKRQGNI